MKHLLFLSLFVSFSTLSQSNEKFQISGAYKNIEYPVKTQLLLTQDDGEVMLLDQQFGLGYSYSLEQNKNYEIRFTYSPSLVKTITIIPRDVAHYELNVNFDLREKVHCVLIFEENESYGMYLLTDKEKLNIINSREVAYE